VRAVLDPNVIISGLLSPPGNAARLLRAWERGEYELIVSVALIAELERALAYPKLRRRISEEDGRVFLDWLAETATSAGDPEAPPDVPSADPGDDYLIALAASRLAILVSGDKHLLELADEIPIFTPAAFLDLLSTPNVDTGI
jgi:putative PIN family toxin of toxin-antitoxin system